MTQFSSTGNDIEIDNLSGELIFIDPLYLGEIAEAFDSIKNKDKRSGKEFIKLIEEAIFPYGGGTLIGFKTVDKDSRIYRFRLDSMSNFDDENEEIEFQASQKDITTVGIDSASFLILDLKNFEMLMTLIKYDDLAELTIDNNLYFEAINRRIGNKGWGYVTSPGCDSGYIFEGDGCYLIT